MRHTADPEKREGLVPESHEKWVPTGRGLLFPGGGRMAYSTNCGTTGRYFCHIGLITSFVVCIRKIIILHCVTKIL